MADPLARYRPSVKVPDGRIFYGIHSQSLSETNGETPYIRALAAQVRGVAEVTLPAGRADVLNETTAFEVEAVGGWRAGLRQAYGYAAMTGTAPAVALFGQANYAKIYRAIRDKMPGMQLWIWDSATSRFEHCQSARLANRYTPSQRRPKARIRRAAPYVPLPAEPVTAPVMSRADVHRAIDDPVRLASAARLMRNAIERGRATPAKPALLLPNALESEITDG